MRRRYSRTTGDRESESCLEARACRRHSKKTLELASLLREPDCRGASRVVRVSPAATPTLAARGCLVGCPPGWTGPSGGLQALRATLGPVAWAFGSSAQRCLIQQIEGST